jgi:hypothetical protein
MIEQPAIKKENAHNYGFIVNLYKKWAEKWIYSKYETIVTLSAIFDINVTQHNNINNNGFIANQLT